MEFLIGPFFIIVGFFKVRKWNRELRAMGPSGRVQFPRVTQALQDKATRAFVWVLFGGFAELIILMAKLSGRK